MDLCRTVSEQGNIKSGIFLIGAVGSGKTHLLAAIVSALVSKNPDRYSRIMFLSVLELMSKIKQAWNNHDESYVADVQRIPFLFIDDLGMETEKDWSFQELLSIFSFRYNQELPTFITSNLSEKELLDRYGSAVVSRLTQMCHMAKIDAPNYRPKLKPVLIKE